MIKCPKCGKSHYSECGGTTTCLGWTPIYKDGVLVNSDPNKTTWHYHCLECGENFTSDSAIYEKDEGVVTIDIASMVSRSNLVSVYKYYEIYTKAQVFEECATVPQFVCIVDDEYIAKDFCKRHEEYEYKTVYYEKPISVAN